MIAADATPRLSRSGIARSASAASASTRICRDGVRPSPHRALSPLRDAARRTAETSAASVYAVAPAVERAAWRERLALAVRCAAVADLLDAPSIVACAVAVAGRLLDPRAVRFVRLALDLLDALGRACAVRTMPRLFRAGNGSRPLADPVGTTSPLRVVEVRRSPSASGRVSLTH